MKRSALFNYSKKSTFRKQNVKNEEELEHEDDDNDDGYNSNGMPNKRSTVNSKGYSNKPGSINLIDSDDDDDDFRSGRGNSLQTDRNKEAKKAVELLKAKELNVRETITTNVIPDTPVDETLERAKELLQATRRTELQLINLTENIVPTQPRNQRSSIYIPVVKTADERSRPTKLVTIDTFIDMENEMSGIGAASVSTKSAIGDESSTVLKIQLKTRLNGSQDLWVWKMAPTEPFQKLRQSICDVYGLTGADVKLYFDGDCVDDDETPNDKDMEADDLIDLKIPKEKVAAAVAHAEEHKKNKAAAAAASSAALSASASASMSRINANTTTSAVITTTAIASTPSIASANISASASSTTLSSSVTAVVPSAPRATAPSAATTANSQVITVNIKIPGNLCNVAEAGATERDDNDVCVSVKAYLSFALRVLLTRTLTSAVLKVTREDGTVADVDSFDICREDSSAVVSVDETLAALGLPDGCVLLLREKPMEITIAVSVGHTKKGDVRVIAKPEQILTTLIDRVAKLFKVSPTTAVCKSQARTLSDGKRISERVLVTNQSFAANNIKSGDVITFTSPAH